MLELGPLLVDANDCSSIDVLETSSKYVSDALATWQVYLVVPYFSLVSTVA